MGRHSGKLGWVLTLPMLGVLLATMVLGCSKPRTEEQAQQQAVESGKAIGMKQAEMMKQGKMGMPKMGQ